MEKSLKELKEELVNAKGLYAYELREQYTGRVDVVAKLAYQIRALEANIEEMKGKKEIKS